MMRCMSLNRRCKEDHRTETCTCAVMVLAARRDGASANGATISQLLFSVLSQYSGC